MRSRASSLPLACWRSTDRSEPAWSASSLSLFSCSMRSGMVCCDIGRQCTGRPWGGPNAAVRAGRPTGRRTGRRPGGEPSPAGSFSAMAEPPTDLRVLRLEARHSPPASPPPPRIWAGCWPIGASGWSTAGPRSGSWARWPTPPWPPAARSSGSSPTSCSTDEVAHDGLTELHVVTLDARAQGADVRAGRRLHRPARRLRHHRGGGRGGDLDPAGHPRQAGAACSTSTATTSTCVAFLDRAVADGLLTPGSRAPAAPATTIPAACSTRWARSGPDRTGPAPDRRPDASPDGP